MEYSERKYPAFSVCGLNCGLCPRYHASGPSKCPGCAGYNFSNKHPKCGVLSCNQRKGLEYCYECSEFPCRKYDDADRSDSFISHLNQFRDMKKASEIGIDIYMSELESKISILEYLLVNYDDGRQKGFYCLAINLLELVDLKEVLEEIQTTVTANMDTKEKVLLVRNLFEKAATRKNIILKLRGKQNK